MGAGVALLDHDGDGDLDAYLTNGGTLDGGEPVSDALFANDGGARFRDVSAEAGVGDLAWTQAAIAADLTGDGLPEVLLANWGPNALLLNEGGRLRDVAAAAGVAEERWSTGAVFLDADVDGDLDLYVSNYVVLEADALPEARFSYRGVEVSYGPRGLPGERDSFYRNEGTQGAAPRFVEVTEEAGLADSEGYGFQAVTFDYDEDGFGDVFVANDSTPNYLWRNVGGARFEDRAFQAGVALSRNGVEQAGMGVAVGDVNHDGHLDGYVTNFSEDYNTLYLGDGGGLFSDATLRWQVAFPTMASLGWSTGFVDLDGDGDEDLFAVNGHVYPQVDRFDLGTRYRQRNQVFVNEGGAGLREVSAGSGPGFEVEEASRGAAWGDLDGDGDVDLLVGNLDAPPTLLINESPRAGAFVAVRLRGAGSNRDAVGARLWARIGDHRRVWPIAAGSGCFSSSDPTVHVGLGPAEKVDAFEVLWPSGRREVFPGAKKGARVRLEEGRGAGPAPDGDSGD